MSGLPYVAPPEWGQAMRQIKTSVCVDQAAFDRLAFKVLAMGGENFASWQMPGHDPPVAWRAGNFAGIPVIACPATAKAWSLTDEVRYMDPEPIILDAEPGRRP